MEGISLIGVGVGQMTYFLERHVSKKGLEEKIHKSGLLAPCLERAHLSSTLLNLDMYHCQNRTDRSLRTYNGRTFPLVLTVIVIITNESC
jgi:hypothetical protein